MYSDIRALTGDAERSGYFEYRVPIGEGMVILDAIHWVQANLAADLAVRWNCKAAKCGSCCAEVNGKPRLLCKTRMSDFPEGEAITVMPRVALTLARRPTVRTQRRKYRRWGSRKSKPLTRRMDTWRAKSRRTGTCWPQSPS